MVATGNFVRAAFWRCVASLMEKCVELQPFLSRDKHVFPFLLGGALAFLLGALAGELVLHILF